MEVSEPSSSVCISGLGVNFLVCIIGLEDEVTGQLYAVLEEKDL